MNINIVHQAQPKFEKEFYHRRKGEIVSNYQNKIKNSESFFQKLKFWLVMKYELTNLSPLINLYLKKNRKIQVEKKVI